LLLKNIFSKQLVIIFTKFKIEVAMSRIRIAINGFGRIGRLVYRIMREREDKFEIVAINGRKDADVHAHLLKYDTVHGKYKNDVQVINTELFTDNGNEVKVLKHAQPSDMPWDKLNIDVVIEATGQFKLMSEISGHIRSGAKKVLLTVPSKDPVDATIVMGVNEEMLKANHLIVSNASCTTNCLAPVAKIINDNFGIHHGTMTTVHAYTNDQNIVDASHKDLRRARAGVENIIPTSTGAAKAIRDVIPELDGKLTGMAIRVPVANGSIIDFTCVLDKKVTQDEVNNLFKAEALGKYKGIVEYTIDPIVSSDIIGSSASAVFDSLSTRVMYEKTLKVLAWYDNEWGYSCRVVDLIEKMMSFR
jgi:glyceraldehyde 3-phosphate dehydrogenase